MDTPQGGKRRNYSPNNYDRSSTAASPTDQQLPPADLERSHSQLLSRGGSKQRNSPEKEARHKFGSEENLDRYSNRGLTPTSTYTPGKMAPSNRDPSSQPRLAYSDNESSVASSLSETSGHKHNRKPRGKASNNRLDRDSRSLTNSPQRLAGSPQQQQFQHQRLLHESRSEGSMEGKDLTQLAALNDDGFYDEQPHGSSAEEKFNKLRSDFLNMKKISPKKFNPSDVSKSKIDGVLGVLQPKSSVLRLEPVRHIWILYASSVRFLIIDVLV
jgi:hypothetical protein